MRRVCRRAIRRRGRRLAPGSGEFHIVANFEGVESARRGDDVFALGVGDAVGLDGNIDATAVPTNDLLESQRRSRGASSLVRGGFPRSRTCSRQAPPVRPSGGRVSARRWRNSSRRGALRPSRPRFQVVSWEYQPVVPTTMRPPCSEHGAHIFNGRFGSSEVHHHINAGEIRAPSSADACSFSVMSSGAHLVAPLARHLGNERAGFPFAKHQNQHKDSSWRPNLFQIALDHLSQKSPGVLGFDIIRGNAASIVEREFWGSELLYYLIITPARQRGAGR